MYEDSMGFIYIAIFVWYQCGLFGGRLEDGQCLLNTLIAIGKIKC